MTFCGIFVLCCASTFVLTNGIHQRETNSDVNALREVLEPRDEESMTDKRDETSTYESWLENVKRTIEDYKTHVAKQQTSEERGLWDDFKASVKKAGKKIKEKLGKRGTAEESEMENQKEEMRSEADSSEKENEEIQKRDSRNFMNEVKTKTEERKEVWDDLKSSMEKKGAKIKEAFGKREPGILDDRKSSKRSELWGKEKVKNTVILEETVKKEEKQVVDVFNNEVKRGMWDDLKNSVKKVGTKVKNAFGKREKDERKIEGASAEIETVIKKKKREAVDAFNNEVKRGMWDDLKNSVKKVGTKVKNAFSKREKDERKVEGASAEIETVIKNKKREAVAAFDNEVKRGMWDDLKNSVKKVGTKIKNTFGKREKDQVEGTSANVENETKRGEMWEDFTTNLRKTGRKIHDAFGKRERLEEKDSRASGILGSGYRDSGFKDSGEIAQELRREAENLRKVAKDSGAEEDVAELVSWMETLAGSLEESEQLEYLLKRDLAHVVDMEERGLWQDVKDTVRRARLKLKTKMGSYKPS